MRGCIFEAGCRILEAQREAIAMDGTVWCCRHPRWPCGLALESIDEHCELHRATTNTVNSTADKVVCVCVCVDEALHQHKKTLSCICTCIHVTGYWYLERPAPWRPPAAWPCARPPPGPEVQYSGAGAAMCIIAARHSMGRGHAAGPQPAITGHSENKSRPNQDLDQKL